MESDYLVEVTHGINELGKDLVIVKQDNISTDIFGIVVKVGDIKGKTLGDVDELSLKVKNIFTASEENKISEIESQILQARNHPAEIKTIFAKLPVSKIIVILAGDLSGNARTRIEGEFSSGITIYDMNWLIDKFTEHYPQIYFEAKAVDFLQEKIHSLESSDLLIKNKNKNLSDYYVDPLIQETETPVTASDGRISLKKKNRFKFSEIVSTMKTTKKVIICGDPGSGKSNALTKLAIDIYKEAYKETTKGGNTKKKISIPLFIPAKELVTIDSAKDLKNYCSLNDEIEDVFSIDLLLIDAFVNGR
jgi:primosomal protein N'